MHYTLHLHSPLLLPSQRIRKRVAQWLVESKEGGDGAATRKDGAASSTASSTASCVPKGGGLFVETSSLAEHSDFPQLSAKRTGQATQAGKAGRAGGASGGEGQLQMVWEHEEEGDGNSAQQAYASLGARQGEPPKIKLRLTLSHLRVLYSLHTVLYSLYTVLYHTCGYDRTNHCSLY
jgi:hypothetical protein